MRQSFGRQTPKYILLIKKFLSPFSCVYFQVPVEGQVLDNSYKFCHDSYRLNYLLITLYLKGESRFYFLLELSQPQGGKSMPGVVAPPPTQLRVHLQPR